MIPGDWELGNRFGVDATQTSTCPWEPLGGTQHSSDTGAGSFAKQFENRGKKKRNKTNKTLQEKLLSSTLPKEIGSLFFFPPFFFHI